MIQAIQAIRARARYEHLAGRHVEVRYQRLLTVHSMRYGTMHPLVRVAVDGPLLAVTGETLYVSGFAELHRIPVAWVTGIREVTVEDGSKWPLARIRGVRVHPRPALGDNLADRHLAAEHVADRASGLRDSQGPTLPDGPGLHGRAGDLARVVDRVVDL